MRMILVWSAAREVERACEDTRKTRAISDETRPEPTNDETRLESTREMVQWLPGFAFGITTGATFMYLGLYLFGYIR